MKYPHWSRNRKVEEPIGDLIDLSFEKDVPKPEMTKEMTIPAKEMTIPAKEIHLKTELKIKKKDSKDYLTHPVRLTDTLIGLSLKYGVSVDEIKVSNGLYSDAIWSHIELLIPYRNQKIEELTEEEKEKQEKDRMRLLIRRFQRVTKCNSEAEATYYLDSNQFDFDVALSEYNEDIKWAASHQLEFQEYLHQKSSKISQKRPSISRIDCS